MRGQDLRVVPVWSQTQPDCLLLDNNDITKLDGLEEYTSLQKVSLPFKQSVQGINRSTGQIKIQIHTSDVFGNKSYKSIYTLVQTTTAGQLSSVVLVHYHHVVACLGSCPTLSLVKFCLNVYNVKTYSRNL